MAPTPRDRSLPMGEPGEQTWIVESAAARVLRAAVDGLPGVRAADFRVVPEPDLRAVRVHVEVAADLAGGLHEAADAVRGRIVATAREAIGLEVSVVDVAIVDLLTDEEARR